MHSKRKTIYIIALFAGVLFVLITSQGSIGAQGNNLLTNPGFEGQYSSYIPETAQEVSDCPRDICNTAQMPPGWKPWWVKERSTDVNPEYKPAESSAPGNRVRGGQRAAQYFSFWSTHKAGLRQTVPVPAGSTVEFSIWGMSWMSESDNSLVSDYSGTPNMRVGIDPTGGTNVYSPSIVWSGFLQPFDQYQPFSIAAQAQGDKVTVFTYSAPSVNPNSPEYGFKHTDVYWDDAALTVVGAGSASAPPPPPPSDSGGGSGSSDTNPAPAPAAPYVPGPTPTPNAEGIIYIEVQSGDSIWALSARAGISLDEFLELNEMGRDDLIRPGDLFIVGFGDPPGEVEEEEVEAASNAAGESSPEETVEAEPEEEANAVVQEVSRQSDDPTDSIALVSRTESGATICLMAYDDPNQNGVRDGGEPLRPAVAFTISDGQSVVSNYVTDGDSEPFCITGLSEGSYRVARSSRPGEIMTTPGDRAVSVATDSTLGLEFGSYISQKDLALVNAGQGDSGFENDSTQDTLHSDINSESSDGIGGLIIGAVVVALLLLVAVIVVIYTTRRSTADSS